MKSLLLAAALLLPAAALAQPAAPPNLKILATSAEMQALIAKARSELKPGQAFVSETILAVKPYRIGLEFRTPNAPPTAHLTEAEIIYVIEGTGTIVTGGTLTEAKNTNPANLAGTGIADGTVNAMAKGDLLFVPQGVPHWVRANASGDFVLMTLHVPGPPAEK